MWSPTAMPKAAIFVGADFHRLRIRAAVADEDRDAAGEGGQGP